MKVDKKVETTSYTITLEDLHKIHIDADNVTEVHISPLGTELYITCEKEV